MNKGLSICWLFAICLLPLFTQAQLPVCGSGGNGIIYSQTATSYYNYDPTLPISATNPSLNTIPLPLGGDGLSLNNNLNASSPSPTFYIILSGYYYYYNGTSWVNTGHTTSGGEGIGGGGGYIYSMVSSTHTIYKYDGTANAGLLLTLPTGTNFVKDIVADCMGNFYLLDIIDNPQWMREYNSSGTLINSWTISGVSTSSQSFCFAIINNHVYFQDGVGAHFWDGVISGGNISFTTNTPISPAPGDFASCPFNVNVASIYPDTAYYCTGGVADTLIANGQGTLTWSVVNGPAVITGMGDTVTVTASANSTLVLSSSITTCGPNTDTISIIVPPMAAVNGNSPICSGDSLLLSSNGYTGTSYSWHGPNNFSDTIQNTYKTNMALADSGYYAVTETFHACVSSDSVFISVKPMPAIPIVNSNSPICAGDSLKLTVSPANGGISYSWSGPASFSDTGQNPVRVNASVSYSGVYTVVANLNGCTDTATTAVTVNPTIGPPTINITVSPNDTICAGISASFTASAGNAGSPVYAWRKNGLSVGTNSTSYAPGSIANGDVLVCKVTSNTQCQPIDTALSNAITMRVLPITTPTVSITSQPVVVLANHTDTFYAGITNCLSPSYQWYRNGNKINGATGTMYSGYILAGDQISVKVHCGGWCEQPDSAQSNTLVALGVNSEQLTVNNAKVYPNPITNELIIESAERGTVIKIFNIVGQQLYYGIAGNDKEIVNTNNLSNGTYILELINTDGQREIRKIIK